MEKINESRLTMGKTKSKIKKKKRRLKEAAIKNGTPNNKKSK